LQKQMNSNKEYLVTIPPDPTDAELIDVRRTLREVLGYPEPVDSPSPEDGDGLYDIYHDLMVGPIDPESGQLVPEGW
jgi:hypothetical protein